MAEKPQRSPSDDYEDEELEMLNLRGTAISKEVLEKFHKKVPGGAG